MESPSDSVNNPILKLSNEHRIIMDYVVRLERALEEGDYSGLVAAWKAVEVEFQREIQAHFSLEERVIFPSALLGLSTAESVVLVLSLQKEHGIVEGLLAEIVTLVDVDGGRTMVLLRDTLTRAIARLLSCLKKHAGREVTVLFPMISGHEKCQAIVQQLMATNLSS